MNKPNNTNEEQKAAQQSAAEADLLKAYQDNSLTGAAHENTHTIGWWGIYPPLSPYDYPPHRYGACPSCGHCPHCGRGGHHAQPYPTHPNPWITWQAGQNIQFWPACHVIHGFGCVGYGCA